MATCLEQTGADKVVLVGHSAGGWLARAALADGEWEEGIASEDVVAGERGYETKPWGEALYGKSCTSGVSFILLYRSLYLPCLLLGSPSLGVAFPEGYSLLIPANSRCTNANHNSWKPSPSFSTQIALLPPSPPFAIAFDRARHARHPSLRGAHGHGKVDKVSTLSLTR